MVFVTVLQALEVARRNIGCDQRAEHWRSDCRSPTWPLTRANRETAAVEVEAEPECQTWVVATPSYDKAESLATTNLLFVVDGGVPLEGMYVVADASQMKRYAHVANRFIGIIVLSAEPVIYKQRNAIPSYFADCQHIIEVDDDIASMHALGTTAKMAAKLIPKN